MNITEAKKQCEELTKQIAEIRSKHDFGYLARAFGREKMKPLEDELDKLLTAILEVEDKTEIEI